MNLVKNNDSAFFNQNGIVVFSACVCWPIAYGEANKLCFAEHEAIVWSEVHVAHPEISRRTLEIRLVAKLGSSLPAGVNRVSGKAVRRIFTQG